MLEELFTEANTLAQTLIEDANAVKREAEAERARARHETEEAAKIIRETNSSRKLVMCVKLLHNLTESWYSRLLALNFLRRHVNKYFRLWRPPVGPLQPQVPPVCAEWLQLAPALCWRRQQSAPCRPCPRGGQPLEPKTCSRPVLSRRSVQTSVGADRAGCMRCC